jgi:hypothetical protein
MRPAGFGYSPHLDFRLKRWSQISNGFRRDLDLIDDLVDAPGDLNALDLDRTSMSAPDLTVVCTLL